MKGLIAAAVIGICSVVALQGGNDQPAHSDDSQLEQGMSRVDHALQRGLNGETHDKLAKQADSSAKWLESFGESVSSAAD